MLIVFLLLEVVFYDSCASCFRDSSHGYDFSQGCRSHSNSHIGIQVPGDCKLFYLTDLKQAVGVEIFDEIITTEL